VRKDYDEPTLTYHLGVKFSLKNFIRVHAPAGMYIYPFFAASPITYSVAAAEKDNPTKEFRCSGNMYREEFSYEFPSDINILAIPDGVSTETSLQSYKSTYVQDGHIVKITRTMRDSTPGPICKPEIYKLYKDTANQIWPDLKSQIVYK
jgi:hypothetical protein